MQWKIFKLKQQKKNIVQEKLTTSKDAGMEPSYDRVSCENRTSQSESNKVEQKICKYKICKKYFGKRSRNREMQLWIHGATTYLHKNNQEKGQYWEKLFYKFREVIVTQQNYF